MMKIKLMMAILAISFFAVACGESEEKKAEAAAQIEETRELGNKLDELQEEIEEIEKAEADVDATMNELESL
jgi:outer membrane murein-binding lipoprotein Lpp